MTRTVKTIYRPHREDIADLVTRRPMHSMEAMNPFLFINHHGPQVYDRDNRGLPFGPHPHRGFETLTFIVEGSLVHRDSSGHESAITTGGIQWMTAGRGVEHSETSSDEFRRAGGPLEILQLWINLPSHLKMTEPNYVGLQRDQIPAFEDGAATVHLISGEYDGHRGPISSLTGVTMAMIELASGESAALPAPRDRRVFLYVVRGSVTVAGERVESFHLADLKNDGETVEIEASGDSLIIFGHAEPIHEPIASWGPFVMNTHAEIRQTISDYEAGRFGRL